MAPEVEGVTSKGGVTIPVPIRCAFRVLHPFRYFRPKSGRADAGWSSIVDEIAKHTRITRPEPPTERAVPAAGAPHDLPVWQRATDSGRARLNPLYHTELLHPAVQALFGGRESDAAYLRLTPEFVAEVLLRGNRNGTVKPAIAMRYSAEGSRFSDGGEEPGVPKASHRHGMAGVFVSLYDGRRSLINASDDMLSGEAFDRAPRAHRRLAVCKMIGEADSPAELWLSPYGIGVVSLTFDLLPQAADDEHLRHQCYSLTLSDPERAPWVVFGRLDDHVRMGSVVQEAQVRGDAPRRTLDHVPQLCGVSHPAEYRLGRPDHALRLTEYRDLLLAGLPRVGLDLASSDSARRHVVYGVARLTVAGTGAPGWARDLALAMAQCEERSHPGQATGAEPGIPHAWLNAATCAAVSDQGAARVVLDQPEPAGPRRSEGFNYERYLRSRDRAFVVYLTALMQRLVLERIRGSVSQAIAASRNRPLVDVREAIAPDHRDLLDFAASTMLPVVSTRESYNRWYEMARTGNRVDQHYRELQRVLESLDLSAQLAAQRRQAEESATSLSAITALQEDARDAGSRARVLEALIAGLAGLQFWFAISALSREGFWYKVAVGTVAYLGALSLAWRALSLPLKRLWIYGVAVPLPLLAAAWWLPAARPAPATPAVRIGVDPVRPTRNSGTTPTTSPPPPAAAATQPRDTARPSSVPARANAPARRSAPPARKEP